MKRYKKKFFGGSRHDRRRQHCVGLCGIGQFGFLTFQVPTDKEMCLQGRNVSFILFHPLVNGPGGIRRSPRGGNFLSPHIV
jgi:hypothetical protein